MSVYLRLREASFRQLAPYRPPTGPYRHPTGLLQARCKAPYRPSTRRPPATTGSPQSFISSAHQINVTLVFTTLLTPARCLLGACRSAGPLQAATVLVALLDIDQSASPAAELVWTQTPHENGMGESVRY